MASGRPAGGPRALLIAGPTASGKSALAAGIAERLGGVVINADSMQVYADLAILTARPGEAELMRAPHALYGTVDGAVIYSVKRWLADVTPHLAEAGPLPIIVGGTGLYFKALISGLSPIPEVPDAVRIAVRALAEGRQPAELHALLTRRDPATAGRLRPTDPQRIIRALEVHEATGGSLAAYQSRRDPPLLDLARCAPVTLTVERETLRQRIDRRFDMMVGNGALAEVERLAARKLSPTLPAMRALGVPALIGALRGERPLAEAISMAKTETRRYAKRQETFFRHQLGDFTPVTPDEAERRLLHAAVAPYS